MIDGFFILILRLFRLNCMRKALKIKRFDLLEIRDEKGSSKALLCPDARENLWFSVQTGVVRLQKILFKEFSLARLKLACNFLTSLTLEIRDEEGISKALLCPDARENLWFSVQTGVSRLQKILFKGFLLAKLKFQWNFLTLLTLKNQGAFQTTARY